MSTECIFCRIISGEIPTEKLYSDELVTAFRDIHPKAPTHILIVPNKHLVSVNDVKLEDEEMIGRLFIAARNLAEREGVDQSGYRLIINTGPDGGQEVLHLHMHLLGGQRMRYPIG